MRGGSLRRCSPTSQDGGGLLSKILFPLMKSGVKRVQKRVKNAVKRKATQVIDRVSKRARIGVIDVLGE